MPRQKKERSGLTEPSYTCFKLTGVPQHKIKRVEIDPDEFQALIFADQEGLSMQAGADKMRISTSTFNRMINLAYQKISEALIKGYAIRVYKENDTGCDDK